MGQVAIGGKPDSDTKAPRPVSRSPREVWVVEGSERHGIKEVTGPAGCCSDLQTSAVICHSSAVYWLGYPLLQEALLIPHAGCDPTALWDFLSLSL